MSEHEEQVAPTTNEREPIQDMVVRDIEARKALGKQRYGTALQAFNGRDALRDAYEEALDLACYLRQAIEERDNAVPADADQFRDRQGDLWTRREDGLFTVEGGEGGYSRPRIERRWGPVYPA